MLMALALQMHMGKRSLVASKLRSDWLGPFNSMLAGAQEANSFAAIPDGKHSSRKGGHPYCHCGPA